MSSGKMQIKVLFFATLKDRAGVPETVFDLPEPIPVQRMKELLAERFPGLEEALPSSLISINREFAFDQDFVPAGAEVAIFPPVSGGSERTGTLTPRGETFSV